jgi:hypothetical protein
MGRSDGRPYFSDARVEVWNQLVCCAILPNLERGLKLLCGSQRHLAAASMTNPGGTGRPGLATVPG